MTAPSGVDRALRAVVLLAGLAVTARWEHAYGATIGLDALAWAIPVLTAGYLTLAIRRGRDVAAAMCAALASTLVGALASTLPVPAPVLAAATATLVAAVAFRAHTILEGDRPDPGPVACPADRLAPDAPVPVVPALRRAGVGDGDRSPRAVARQVVLDHAGAELDDRQVRDLIAVALPGLSRDAVRGLHRRVAAELEDA
jgi:hypothetical protein